MNHEPLLVYLRAIERRRRAPERIFRVALVILGLLLLWAARRP